MFVIRNDKGRILGLRRQWHVVRASATKQARGVMIGPWHVAQDLAGRFLCANGKWVPLRMFETRADAEAVLEPGHKVLEVTLCK